MISASMPYQMALDEILFRPQSFQMDPDCQKWLEVLRRQPSIRFYASDSPWITVGYSTPEETFASDSYPVCRRITGGGKVYHINDLVISLCGGRGQDESFKSVRLSYLKIHEAVKKGFEILGYHANFYRCNEALPKGNDCFLFPIATDLSLSGRKIAGGAQKRSIGYFLHQESVAIPEGKEFFEVHDVMQRGFKEIFEMNCQMNCPPPELLRLAETVAENNYPAINTKSEMAK